MRAVSVGERRLGEMSDSAQALGEVILTEDAIRAKVEGLAAQITADYEGKRPLLIGVLKGAFIFMADLCRRVELPIEFDFMAVASYGAATQSSGVVRILKDLETEIGGRDVIIVEDIISSGLTLSYLRRILQTRNPASLEICALLVKEGAMVEDIPIRYTGFSIPPQFVVGYGLDVGERYRNLPYLALLSEQ